MSVVKTSCTDRGGPGNIATVAGHAGDISIFESVAVMISLSHSTQSDRTRFMSSQPSSVFFAKKDRIQIQIKKKRQHTEIKKPN